MSTETIDEVATSHSSDPDHVEHDHHDGEHGHGEHGQGEHGFVEGFDRSHDAKYWKVALILAVLTGIEVTTYTNESFWNGIHEKAAIVVLLTLMMVKFVMITWYFMHLEGDWQKGGGGKLLTYVFYAGLALAVVVYLVLLFTFRVIPAPWEWF